VVVKSNDRRAWSGWGIINGIRADPHDFTGAYESIEKDTVAYGSGTWVLWEGHGMLCMLLTECMVCVCQYWMYGHGQEGTFLAWG
jgi:hypothetical protein